MGLATATLNGIRATSARIDMPAWGRWYATVSLDGEHTLSGAATLVVAGLTLVGTVLSGGPAKGRSDYRIVAGKGGWGKVIPAKAYANDAGVKLATVLGDAASAAGETIAGVDTSARVGPAWARDEGIAAHELERLAAHAWYVGEDGVTRLGKRASSVLGAKVPRVSSVDLARGTVTLAPESLAGIVPGVVVDGLTAVDVLHEVTPDGVRTTIYGARSSSTSRKLAAFQAIFDQLDPDRKYRGVTEYRVVTLEGDRVSLQPVRVSTGMPSLRRVPMRPGLAGSHSMLGLGSRVLVGFVDSSPSRPVVLAFEDSEGGGFVPVLTTIDALTLVRIGAGVKPAIAAGDLAGGIWPCVPTQVKVLI